MEPPRKKRKILQDPQLHLPNDVLGLIYAKAKTSLFDIRGVNKFGRNWSNEKIELALRKRFRRLSKAI